MDIKSNFQFSVRAYEASDRRAMLALMSDGVLEHTYPAFFRSLAYPDHLGVALSVGVAGYVLGGSSYLQALLFAGAWAALLYHCCHQVHQRFLQRRLEDTAGMLGAGQPDGGLWVAETAVAGRTRVVGVVGVRGTEGEHPTREKEEEEEEEEPCGELPLLVVAYGVRRRGLGSLLALRALEVCQARHYGRLLVESSSPQSAANALYRKMGFVQTACHAQTHPNRWVASLARVDVLTLEKVL